MKKDNQKEETTLTENDLRQFTGTTRYWRSSLPFHPFLYTDGVHYLANQGQAYWLLDLIGSWQIEPAVKKDPVLLEMQFWTLRVNENSSAVAICERDSGDIVVTQRIPYTDFPLREVRLYLAHMANYWNYSSERGPRTTSDYGVLLLPSEY
ncbi:hypothetical protein C7293_04820 [filamentous cyanobacterium CCT1]|nr:hypothetical protein C7293_04820 [filamentous cyanobacterium CCT1]PSN79017.1 hypothetical protein C8B47_13975 [filamentous cyanobacterium CCP4]